MRKFKIIIALCCLVCTPLSNASSISGKLLDPDGGVVVDTELLLTHKESSETHKFTSLSDGSFFFLDIPAGTYDINIPIACCQYSSFSENGIALGLDSDLALNLPINWGMNLGTLGDDPGAIVNEMRGRTVVRTDPAPRMVDGTVDLSGVWATVIDADGGPDMPLQDWSLDIRNKRLADDLVNAPGNFCLPNATTPTMLRFPYKIIHAKDVIVMLHEYDTPGFRQIFLDGREHPKLWNPAWMGHSIGHWEGDVLVVETTGFNDKGWLYPGAPHTESLKVIERFTRSDYGHLEIKFEIEDAGALTEIFYKSADATLAGEDEEILEFICNENNKTFAEN